MRAIRRFYFYFLALCLVLSSPTSTTPAMAEARKEKTHYQVLELSQDASLKDVKKAYRKLAVRHHPDRNLGNEEEATIKFREISEAYEVLSDEDSRREYDRALKGGFGRSFGERFHGGGGHGRRHRDPFSQFNDVFRNDPFFAEAARSMDDLFDKHFAEGGGGSRQKDDVPGGGGGGWFDGFKRFMPDIQVTTSTTTNFGGSTSRSSTSRSYGGGWGGGGNGRRSGGRSTYTSRSTRTVVENGRRVTIQSLEKDGNRIEEKYVGEKLIERKINGRKEDLGRIGDREEF